MKFSKNNLVLVSTKNLRIKDISKKIAPRIIGLFRINKLVSL